MKRLSSLKNVKQNSMKRLSSLKNVKQKMFGGAKLAHQKLGIALPSGTKDAKEISDDSSDEDLGGADTFDTSGFGGATFSTGSSFSTGAVDDSDSSDDDEEDVVGVITTNVDIGKSSKDVADEIQNLSLDATLVEVDEDESSSDEDDEGDNVVMAADDDDLGI